jgi:hypothetical protein
MLVGGPDKEKAERLFRWWMSAHLKADDAEVSLANLQGAAPLALLQYEDPVRHYLES